MPPVLLAALAGCTPGTLDLVQPGAIDKDALSGEWYWRRTVANVPYGTASTFTGASDDLERIRWRFEKDLLLGYRSYPNVEDTAPSGLEDQGFYGAPLLAFAIEKHFDIRRSYDHVTGEESNVIEENTERPWNEAEYVRVDWSANLAEAGFDAAGLSSAVLDYATDVSGTAPEFDDSDGDGEIDSLMLTQHVLLEPSSENLPGYGEVPVCLFFGQAEYECAATEVDVVSSFVKVGSRAPYQGVAYDDRYMQTFGFFETERLAYDRAYGLVEPNRTRFANLHPLWEESVATDARGLPLCRSKGEEAPCAAFSSADEPQVVSIPYRQRKVRPIVYHAGPDFPEDLKPVMADVAAEWNEPLANTVNELRYWECVDDGGKAKDCDAERDPNLQVFVFCPNNPSLSSDPDVCSTDHTGPFGRPDGVPDPVRIGDLRYHLAEVIDAPQIASPFGYGPSAADPVGAQLDLADGKLPLGGGEIVSGTAYVYGHVLDMVATQVADLVDLLNGNLAPDEFVVGENVQAWVDAVRSGDVKSLTGTTAGVPTTWSEPDVRDRLGLISNGFAPSLSTLHDRTRPTTPAAFKAYMEEAGRAIDRSGVFGAGQAEVIANFDAMRTDPVSDLAWTTETIGEMGFDPAVVSSADLAAKSPLDLVAPDTRAIREAGLVEAGKHAVDIDDGAFTDSSLLGLARHYAEIGASREEILADVRANTLREVLLHEVGHTLGLRHNFGGSFDALNFRPEYWNLRDDGDMGPRHVDPETQQEIDGRIHEYQYSTVMDYPGSRNVGWAGLGHYDHAAIEFGYGQLLEVLTKVPEEDVVQGLHNKDALAYVSAYNLSNAYPSVLLFYTSGKMLDLHYTDYPRIAGDLEARKLVPLARTKSVLTEDGAMGDGLVVAKKGGGVDEGMPAVPYRFCSDEFAVGVTCARFDDGADPYEVNQFYIERYWNDYLLSNFARARYGFGDSGSYVSRLYSRTFEPIGTWQRYYALLHGVLGADTDQNVADYFAADKGFGGWTAATDESFRFLVQVVTRPEPGQHSVVTRPDGIELLAPDSAGDVEIPIVTGAYYESEWDFESGYHWFETQSRVGSYWDRMLALLTLTDTQSSGFMGYDTAIDPRSYAIGYQDLYADALQLVLGQLQADEADRFAPAIDANGNLQYPDPLTFHAQWPPKDSTLVEPAAYWLVQFDAGLFAKALLAHGYDRSYINRARLYVDGTGEAPTPAQGQATVSFTDPFSGKTWTAWSYPAKDEQGALLTDRTGDTVELGSSARMLRKANELAALCETDTAACTRLEQLASDLDLQHELYLTFQAATE